MKWSVGSWGAISLFAAALFQAPVPGALASPPPETKAAAKIDGSVTARGGQPAVNRSLQKGVYSEGELLVKFKPDVPESAKLAKHQRHQAEVVRTHKSLRLQRLRLKKGMSAEEAIESYQGDPDVEYAEPNYLVSVQNTPNDARLGELWGMAKINASAAWDLSTGSDNAVIAVIDTGIDYTHPDLVGNLWVNQAELNGQPGLDDDGNGYVDDIYGYNAIMNSGDPKDDHYHGTHVAGTVAAVGNNAEGVVGVAWRAKVMACKFLSSSGSGTMDDAIECLQYVKAMKARGVNIVATSNSWGSLSYTQALYDAIADQKDILFIAAAGNDNSPNPSYPAGFDLPNIISVAASDQNDGKASFSSYGKFGVDIAAPGVGILSTYPGGRYALLSGTSMATPHVSGLAALLYAQDPTRTASNLKNLILTGGDPVSAFADITFTGRRINAYKSLSCTDSPLLALPQLPVAPQAGVPQTLSVLSINCGQPAGPVSATVSGGGSVQLHDDGIAPDEVAGDGIFSGTWTPPATSVYALTFNSPLGSKTITAPALAIGDHPSLSPAATLLPPAATSAGTTTPFSQTLPVTGGVPPFTWSLPGGTLPAGLSLNAASGEISGMQTASGLHKVTLQLNDSQGTSDTKQWSFIFNEGTRAGWPRKLIGNALLPTLASPVVADLDGDGKAEVVVGDQNTLYVYYPDGTYKKAELPDDIFTPAVADLDGDGKKEIIVSIFCPFLHSPTYTANFIYAFHWDLTPVAGFPIGLNLAVGDRFTAPVVADLDNDGEMKIALIASQSWAGAPDYGKKYIVMFDSSGEPVPGWPQVSADVGIWDEEHTPPAVGDVDADGKKELVTANKDGFVRIFRPDGTLLRQWQYETRPLTSIEWNLNPLLTDMDGDGFIDLIVKYRYSGDTVIKVFDRNGVLLPGWPKTVKSSRQSAPALADLDGDGRAELVSLEGGDLYPSAVHAFRGDGSYLPGWPVTVPGSGTYEVNPVIADIDGDGKQEVVVAMGAGTKSPTDGMLIALTGGGQPLAGFPKYASPASGIFTAPAVGDVDANGKADLLVKSNDGYLWNWEVSGQGSSRAPQWPTFRGDETHSGFWVASQLALVPGRHDFGQTVTGSGSTPRAFTIMNPLSRDVTVAPVISGAGGGAFSLTAGSCGALPVLLKPMQSCSVNVTFQPADLGEKRALFSAAGPGLVPATASLTGTGVVASYRLDYGKTGSGSGTVNTSTGNSYADSATERVATSTRITLVATPESGSVFTGWQGACSGTGDCTFTMDRDLQVGASFESAVDAFYQLSISRSGPVQGAISYSAGESCPGSCDHLYRSGTMVTLTPERSTKASFIRWSGCDSVSGTTCTVAMNRTREVTASFRSIAALSGDSQSTLALDDGGSIWGWGANTYGEVGDGTATSRGIPAKTLGLSDVLAISLANGSVAALKSDGTVYTWGWGGSGELGDGTIGSRRAPGQVPGLTGVVAVARGVHTLALKGDGTVWGWGKNSYGQLGDGSTTDRLAPVQASGLASVTAIAAGSFHSLALKGDGTVWEWGNSYSDYYASTLPKKIDVLSGVIAIAAGDGRSFALKSDGSVWAWGSNYSGEIGDGSLYIQSSPVKVAAVSNPAMIGVGLRHTLAVGSDGSLKAWGSNKDGQLGDGTTVDKSTPNLVPGLSGILAASGGVAHSLSLKENGTVWAWGRGTDFQLGDNSRTTRYLPIQVPNLNLLTTVPATIADPPGGSYNSARNVRLAANKGATIYYTLDGSTPNTGSPVYNGAITISSRTTLKYFAEDAAGNTEPVQTQEYVIGYLPRAEITGAPAAPTSSTSATLKVGGAGVVAYKYRVDAGSYSAESPVSQPVSVQLSSEGSHTVAVLGRDSAGNWQVTPTLVEWRVDLTAPGTTPAPGAGAISKGAGVTLACSDGSGSGCAGTYYCLGTGCTPSATYSAPVPISASTELRFYSFDRAGNQEAVKTASYTLSPLLTVTVSGPGTGTVTSTPAGISTGSSSSAVFPAGSNVTLHAAPGQFSILSGWTGSCSGTADCVLSMTADRTAAATFGKNYAYATFIPTRGLYHASIQAAYDAVAQGEVIRTWGVEFTENLLFSQNRNVTISGGYNDAYTTQDGTTVLQGALRVLKGKVKLERVTFR